MTMDTTPMTEPGARAGRREWLGLAVLALPTILLALDFSVLFLALPHLSADLAPDGAQQLWIMDIYGFMIAGFLVTMGTLGDRVGRRKLLMIGAVAFAGASVLAAYSTSAGMLIATRALLGIAGATLMPSTLSLITTMFTDGKQRAAAIGVWIACFMGGTAVGPVVGGVLLQWFWWGSVFLMGVPVMILLLVTAPVLLPEHSDPAGGKLDLASVALSLAAILPVIFGLKEIAKDGFAVVPLVAVVAGVVFGVLFVRRQRTLTNPLMEVSLFANRAFSGALGVMLLGVLTVGGSTLLFAVYLQDVQGMSPLAAGLWMLPHTAAQMSGVVLATMLVRTIRPAYLIAGGLVIAVVGFLIVSQVSATGGITLAVVGLSIAFFGGAPIAGLGVDLIVSSAPREKAGSASSISETNIEFGMALGVAVMGSIGAAVYRNQMAETSLPADAAEAGDTLAGATTTAADLPGEAGASLLAAAREAFTSGFGTAAAVCAGIAAVVAVLAVTLLRHIPAAGAAEADTAESGVDEEATAEKATIIEE
jgi:DHA2 family multidrug resistance protein-like MFS transporter